MNGTISAEQKSIIAGIVTELVNGTRKVNKDAETKEVLKASAENGRQQEHGKIAASLHIGTFKRLKPMLFNASSRTLQVYS